LHSLRNAPFVRVLALALVASACGTDNPSSPSSGAGAAPQLTAPALEAPSDDQQMDTLRPTLTVRNGTSNQNGTRTYEFQIADNSAFAPVAVTKSGVAEDPAGQTSFTPDQDLQPTTRLYWRVRLAQGTAMSEWSPTGKFRTKLVGFNRDGELYDPLVHGETVGTPVGATTFVPGKGLRIEGETSYVRYQLPRTISTGEFSMEVEGLHANGPGIKLKIFSMLDGPGDLIASRYQLSAHYRGRNGNPDNCIAFKAVWGDKDVKLEPDLARRSASVMALDPSRTYFWQGTWNSSAFRLMIRDGGNEGTVIYDHTITAPAGTGPYAPSPHFAYLGANSGAYATETGSWPGATYRNVWLGDKPRPASLGSALVQARQ
jgi:hypothetical protein